jgi:IS4 transposase
MEYYKQGWQIETLFRALKSSGFNREDTHIIDLERL